MSKSSEQENSNTDNSKKSKKTSEKELSKKSKTTSTISGSSKTEDIKIPKIDMKNRFLIDEKKMEEKKREKEEKEEKEKEEERIKNEKKNELLYMDEISKLNDSIKRYLPTPGRKYQQGDYLVECWKCNTLNLVHPSWNCIECSNCKSQFTYSSNYCPSCGSHMVTEGGEE